MKRLILYLCFSFFVLISCKTDIPEKNVSHQSVEKKIKLEYSTEYGKLDFQSKIVTEGYELQEVDLPMLTQNGYKFCGWYNNDKKINIGDKFFDNCKIYAKWKEVSIINGSINSIARYKDKLVITDKDGVKYKSASAEYHGAWDTYEGLPFSLARNDFDTGTIEGEAILKVIADKDYLYLVTAKYNNGYASEFKIWVLTGGLNGIWGTVNLDKISLVSNLFNVFSNNDFDYTKRKAYLRVNIPSTKEGVSTTYKYYELKGKEAPIPYTVDKTNNITDGPANSVANFNGTDYFFNSNSAVVNDTYFYYSVESDLWYGTTKDNVQSSGSAGAPIASLALTADSIIVGCGTGSYAGGIKHAYLADKTKVPGTISNNFSNNTAVQITSSSQVPCVFNATPSESETSSQLYASIIFPGIPTGNSHEKVGLWSYYPKRGNWNKE